MWAVCNRQKPSRPVKNDQALQAVVTASAASSAAGGGSAYSGSGLGGALVSAAVANPEATVAIGSAIASNPAVQKAAISAVRSENPFLDSGSSSTYPLPFAALRVGCLFAAAACVCSVWVCVLTPFPLCFAVPLCRCDTLQVARN